MARPRPVPRPFVEKCGRNSLSVSSGISPGGKDTLFLPHFSTKGRGTGLGLAIAARIISEHGGIIYAEDNFPVGSRFVVVLPAADVAPASAVSSSAEAPR